MNYDRAALIVSGPRDGDLILHPRNTLDIPVPPKITPLAGRHRSTPAEMPEVEVLTFKRIVYKASCSFTYLSVFVPESWTGPHGTNSRRLENLVLSHLLTKAFKGAIGIRQSGQG